MFARITPRKGGALLSIVYDSGKTERMECKNRRDAITKARHIARLFGTQRLVIEDRMGAAVTEPSYTPTVLF